MQAYLFPFAIETASTWHDMAIELMQEVGRRITIITEDTRETTFLFQRQSTALQGRKVISFQNIITTSLNKVVEQFEFSYF